MYDFATQKLMEPMAPAWKRLVEPLLCRLDEVLDRRLVWTVSQSVRAILEHRHRACGLLLSELGGYLLSPGQAPAGTKRLSNLLRSNKWSGEDVSAHLWEQAEAQLHTWLQTGDEVFALWDESVLEKPESQKAQGLCPVRSSKASRLTRIKPGYYRPPGAPIFVPGVNWLALLFIGATPHSGPPCVAAMRWWGTRSLKADTQAPDTQTPDTQTPDTQAGDTQTGDTQAGDTQAGDTQAGDTQAGDTQAGDTQTPDTQTPKASEEPWLQKRGVVQRELLRQCAQSFGGVLLHLFDRGFAGAPWLGELHAHKARFVMRWPKNYKLASEAEHKAGQDKDGERKAWQHLKGQRSWEHQLVPDARRRQMRKMGVIAVRVFHRAYGDGQKPLWLVAARGGQGQEPWYLLTNEPVETPAQAWRIVRAYARRWHIETSFRFQKSELALESPRLWSWERRLKLLMLVTLAYAFLLSLLRLPKEWRDELLRAWCHRTGKRSRETPAPLYRLRMALARLFQEHPPDFVAYQNSG